MVRVWCNHSLLFTPTRRRTRSNATRQTTMRRLPTRHRKRITTGNIRPNTGTKLLRRRNHSRTRSKTRSTSSRRQSNMNSRLKPINKPRGTRNRPNNRLLSRGRLRSGNDERRSKRFVRHRNGNHINRTTHIRHRVMGSRAVSRSNNRSGNRSSLFGRDFQRYCGLLFVNYKGHSPRRGGGGGPSRKAFI